MSSQLLEEWNMDKESPLKINICSQLISRVIVAEATYDADAWACRSLRG